MSTMFIPAVHIGQEKAMDSQTVVSYLVADVGGVSPLWEV